MIKVFYHIYTSTHRILSMSMVDQQLRRIYASRFNQFAELNCVIVGPHHKEVSDLVQRYGGWRILQSLDQDDLALRETRTLQYLWDLTREDDAVLFMHTKGITYASGERSIHGFTTPRHLKAINSWRWAMEHYNIDRWVERFNCFRRTQIQAQGCFLNLTPYKNYVGNFWWSQGQHIRTLPDPREWHNSNKQQAARSWIFAKDVASTCDFHVLDRPRDDGVYVYGAFRLHEDDCLPHVVQDQANHPWPPLGPEHLV